MKNKFMKFTTLIFVLLLSIMQITGQQQNIIPPSPKASLLLKYLEVPVSHSSGVPDDKPYLFSFNPIDIDVTTSYNSFPASKQSITTFTVKDESGNTYIFGDNMHETCLTTNSKFGITTWLLRRITDTSGSNYINYNYAPTPSLRVNDQVGTYTAIYHDSGNYLSLTGVDEPHSIRPAYGCLDNDLLQETDYDGMIISSIEFNSGKIVFDIDASNNLVKGFTVYDKNNKALQKIIFNHSFGGKRKLTSIVITGEDLDVSRGQIYSLIYNNNTMNAMYDGTDFWGYYNGTTEDCTRRSYWYTNSEDFYNQRSYNVTIGTSLNSPSLYHTLFETLTKIIYPTKGEVEFTYELNTYGSNNARDAGGLRIKKIVEKPLTGNDIVKEYEYEGGVIKHDVNADFNYVDTHYYVLESAPYSGTSYVYRNRLYSNLLKGDLANNEVRYAKVTETYKEGVLDEGKSVYHYNFPIINYFQVNTHGESVIMQLKEENFSLPTSIESYKKDLASGEYKIIKNEINKYSFSPDTVFNNYSVFKLTNFPGSFLYDEWQIRDYLRKYAGQLISEIPFDYYTLFGVDSYSILAGRLKLTEKQVITYNYEGSDAETITEKFTYSYDNPLHNYVTRTTTVASDGSTYLTFNSYPFDYNSSIFNTLNMNNVVNKPVCNITYVDGKMTSGSLLKYNAVGKVTEISVAVNELGTAFTVDKNNPYNWGVPKYQFNYRLNNLTEQYGIGTDQLKTVYIWSYSNQYPIAKVVNASHSDIENALGGLNAVTSFANIASPTLSQIKSFIAPLSTNINTKDALVTIYTYKPLIGMTGKIDPNGVVTYYEYDYFGRLDIIKDNNSKTLNKYEYHYKP